MKVLTDVYGSCHFDPVRYLNFTRFENQAGDYLLIQGLPQWRAVEKYRGQKLVYLNFAEPNGLFSPTNLSCHQFENALYKVFTTCPYTTEWLNSKFGVTRRVPIFVPFNEEFLPAQTSKLFDVFYSGSIPSNFVKFIIDTISKFNYCFVSYNQAHKITHIDSTYEQKLSLLAQSKIAVVHNLLFPRPTHIAAARGIYPDVNNNTAFDAAHLALPEPIMPQLKTRVFEAAFCKALILCRRDPWNVIERYFTPDKDFIYYEPHTLEQTIRQVLNNYSTYQPIIESAYNRAINNYTTTHFFNRFLKDLK